MVDFKGMVTFKSEIIQKSMNHEAEMYKILFCQLILILIKSQLYVTDTGCSILIIYADSPE